MEYSELFGIDGEPIEFEWKSCPGFTSLRILEKTRRDLETQQINPRTDNRNDYHHVDVQ